MPPCKRCGADLSEGSRFCPFCGTPVRIERERVELSRGGLWMPRIIAFIIDSVILGLAIAIFSIIMTIPLLVYNPRFLISTSFISGFISVAYFTLMEYFYGYTIGKRITRINVRAVRGGLPTLVMSFIRNVSKIHWILLLLDLILGIATPGDPSQKFSDRYTDTIVTVK